MDKNNNIELTNQIIDFVHKTPEIIKLKNQCEEISVGKRKQISQRTIDDAFDAFSIIVKNVASTPDEENGLYKYFWKNWLCGNLK